MNIDPALNSEVIAEDYLSSGIEMESINYKEALSYIAMIYKDDQIANIKLDRVTPKRRFHRGSRPRVRNHSHLKNQFDGEDVRIFLPFGPTKEEKKVMAACLAGGCTYFFPNSSLS